MAESVYKIIELVGTSTESWEKAAEAAVSPPERGNDVEVQRSPGARLLGAVEYADGGCAALDVGFASHSNRA